MTVSRSKSEQNSAPTLPGILLPCAIYKGAGDTDTHVGHLWASTGGSPLATVTFTDETASGWQEMALPTPVQINANTTYIVSIYSSPMGYFAITPGGLTNAVDNPPLHALATGVDGPNGVYQYGGGFPTGATMPTTGWMWSSKRPCPAITLRQSFRR